MGINKKVLTTINKIQKIPYRGNKEYLELLIKYKGLTHNYLDNSTIRKLKKERAKLYMLKKEAYARHKELVSNKSNLYTNNCYITDLRTKISEIESKFTKYNHFIRILNNLKNISDVRLYYSYELDFRMRIYPQQNELSPQGSKLSRSLILFEEKSEFNLEEFTI